MYDSSNYVAMVMDEDPLWRRHWAQILRALQYQTTECETEDEALACVSERHPQVAVVHFCENVDRSLRCIDRMIELDPTVCPIYATTLDGYAVHTHAMSRGAYTVLNKAVARPSGFRILVDEAWDHCMKLRSRRRESTDVFVAMPLAREFDERYQLGIRQPIESLGLVCHRADESYLSEDIVEHMRARIRASRFVVADLSGSNANVLWEVGYAHGIGKAVILLAQRAGQLPFDLQGMRAVIYGAGLLKLREGLLRAAEELLAASTLRS